MDSETLDDVRYRRFLQTTTKNKLNVVPWPPIKNAALISCI